MRRRAVLECMAPGVFSSQASNSKAAMMRMARIWDRSGTAVRRTWSGASNQLKDMYI